MTMIREWRHLKMVGRAGLVHDARHLTSVQPGELAVECPACPQPEKNLPLGWDQVPECDQ